MNLANIVTRADLEAAIALVNEPSTNLTTLLETIQTTKNKEKRVRRGCALAFAHVGVFAKYMMSEYTTAPFGKHHEPIFNAIPRGAQGKRINILAPRGSAKSTIMAVIYPLHSVFFKWAYDKLGMEPYRFIVIVSKSLPMAKSRVADIKRKIEINPLFQHLKGNHTWGERRLITSNDIMIMPNSRGGQIRGSLFRAARPDLIISDDLDDPETVRNPDVRAKDQLWFDSDFIRAGRPDGKTNFINIDTVKHAEATANLLRDRSGWNTLFFQAIEQPADLWHPTAEEKWREWEQLYTNMSLTDQQRHANAQEFYERNKSVMHNPDQIKELWPEMITYLDVRKEICDTGYFPVMRELQNETHDPTQALFDMDNALRFDIVAEGFLTSDNVLVRWNQMAGATIFLDWAGGKDIADNAFAAAVGVVWVPLPGSNNEKPNSIMDGVHGYVLCAELKRTNVSEQIQMCFNLYEHIQSTVKNRDFRIRFGIEGFVQDTWDAQRQVIERDFRAQREERRRDVQIEWLPRLRNKFDRIDALQPLIHNRWLAFYNGLSDEFMKQMRLYPTGDFVDGPDALEGACQLRISRFNSEIKARKKRIKQRNQNFTVTV